jgi:MFS family permease
VTLSDQTISADTREAIYRRNFAFLLADAVLFILALGVLGTTTVVPDFVRQLTDSEVLIGLSSTLFTVGFTFPQLFVARYIMGASRKKWWFVGPNIPVRFVILIFAFATVWLGPGRPTALLVLFFVAYSIAAFGDGLVGIPWADLTASSLNERWRARVFGVGSLISGGLLLLLTPLIGRVLGSDGLAFPTNYAVVFGIAGVIFVVSIPMGAFVKELPSVRAVEKPPPPSEYIGLLGRLVREDEPFRRFLGSKLLLDLHLMALPFYIGFATEQLGLASEVAVPTLLRVQVIGSLGGALLYTWLGARNNVLFLKLAVGAAMLLPTAALSAVLAGPIPLYAGFVMSGVITTSLGFSYTNWFITYAPPDNRPMQIGLANTLGAVASIIAPVVGGLITASVGYEPLFVISGVLAATGLAVIFRERQPSEWSHNV